MASIYKRARRKPIPEGAEIFPAKGKSKAYAVWTSRGRRQRAPLSDDGKAVVVEPDEYTIEYFDHKGERKRTASGTTDKDAAQQLANHLETEAMHRRRGIIDSRQERLVEQAKRPIDEHVQAYEAKLTAAGRNAQHIRDTMRMIRTIIDEAGFTTAAAITADGVNLVAKNLKDQGEDGKGRSSRRIQAFLTAIKSLTKWLTEEGKLPADPLAGVRKPNPKTDRRKERRMLLPGEWQWLRSATLSENQERFKVAAVERVLLYATAVQTGLRANELRSLTRGRLFLDAPRPYVTCKAGSTKNAQDARQFVNADLAAELRTHVAAKAPGAPLFAMPDKYSLADMLRDDLAGARRAWMEAAKHDSDEYGRRNQGDFLLPTNHDGAVLDFHSLRHTCGAWLALTGAHANEIKTIMRHSSITLTMDTYGHMLPTQEADTVARLPNMLAILPEALAATGTDGAASDDRRNNKAEPVVVRKWAHPGQQLDGETVRKVATDGGNLADSADEIETPNVLPLNTLGKTRRNTAADDENRATWIRTRNQQIMSLLL